MHWIEVLKWWMDYTLYVPVDVRRDYAEMLYLYAGSEGVLGDYCILS